MSLQGIINHPYYFRLRSLVACIYKAPHLKRTFAVLSFSLLSFIRLLTCRFNNDEGVGVSIHFSCKRFSCFLFYLFLDATSGATPGLLKDAM